MHVSDVYVCFICLCLFQMSMSVPDVYVCFRCLCLFQMSMYVSDVYVCFSVYKPDDLNCSLHDNLTLGDSDQCFPGIPGIDRMLAYRLSVIVFSLILGPFVFFNVQKTTILQVITSVFRWIGKTICSVFSDLHLTLTQTISYFDTLISAFITMIVLAIYELSVNGPQGHPKVADLAQVPNLFGVCVYSFMCHHSLPSLVTPIRNKNKLNFLMAMDYGLILVFYSLLSLTAVFAFNNIPDLYTLTFEAKLCPDPMNPAPPFFQYFLALFPVFTLSTNFPIISITLRNNLKALILRQDRTYHFAIDRLLFPFLVLLPPVAVAIATNQIDVLVGITGSYAGAALQYFVPVALVFFARRTVQNTLGVETKFKSQSPFRHNAWLIILNVWAVACIIFVTVKHITGD